MSLPRPGVDYCGRCQLEDCTCRRWYCVECGEQTNHTTKAHREHEAEMILCVECGVNQKMDDDPNTRVCRACADEQVRFRFMDAYDHIAKEINHADDV